MNKIRIMLADDHALFREGLRSLLEDQTDIEIVGEAEDGLEATKLATPLEAGGNFDGYQYAGH